MTVGEIREVSQPSARAWIEKDGNVVFADWFYKVPEDLLKAKVKEFAFAPEICHKDWEKLGLISPMQPEEMPDYSFSDLMMKLYYRMKIQRRSNHNATIQNR